MDDTINNTDLSELTERIESAGPKKLSFPTAEQIEKELSRISRAPKKRNPIITLLLVLIVSAAVVVLVTSFLTPVIKITGSAMQPTLNNEDVSITIKTSNLAAGDVCAFYNNNDLYVRRIIGVPGDEINILEDGTVYVNDRLLEEGYVSETALGDCDIEFPYTVPENSYFVMGDNRPAAKDSRLSQIGCVSVDRIVGKLVFTVWPVYSVGPVN